jgi:NAD(P)-dependent dehydrogenase (short-subunit alcohol dehydrogenase family)
VSSSAIGRKERSWIVLKDKKVIITGAAGGQGRVACQRFAEEGARILATDLSQDPARDIETLAPGTISYLAADVTKSSGSRSIIDHATTLFGGSIDVLYNNHSVILGRPFLAHPRNGTKCTTSTSGRCTS